LRVAYRPMAVRRPDLFDRSVLVVSGKGGVGKTAVAAACARAAAHRRARVLLADIEGREGIARLLRVPPPGFAERPTRFGHAVLSITAKAALLEYLTLFFHMRTLSRSLQRAKVVDVATEAIPGFRDVMVAGKLYELTWWRAGRERRGDRRPYDLVVVDAPPTGQLLPFLRSSTAYRELIRAGRPHRQLESIDRLLREDTRVALVAIPEEMSVAETIETVLALRDANLPDPLVVVNQVTPPPFPKGVRAAALRLEPPDVVRMLKQLEVESDEGAAEDLLRAALDTDARVREERRYIARLEKAAPVLELPFLFTPSFGPDEVGALAGRFSS
jgi:anion-transporting  ArsA/GET3 family ATPase